MFEDVLRALRVPVYSIASALLLSAYVYTYYDYLHTVTASGPALQISVR
jgi:hypothetical protein